MTRLLAATAFALLALLLLHKCRRSPALCAHDPGSEYDRYCFAQAHADAHMQPLRCWGFV